MTPDLFRLEGLKVVRCDGHYMCRSYHHHHAELACGLDYCPDSGRLIVSTMTIYGQRVTELTSVNLNETARILAGVFVQMYPNWRLAEVCLLD